MTFANLLYLLLGMALGVLAARHEPRRHFLLAVQRELAARGPTPPESLLRPTCRGCGDYVAGAGAVWADRRGELYCNNCAEEARR